MFLVFHKMSFLAGLFGLVTSRKLSMVFSHGAPSVLAPPCLEVWVLPPPTSLSALSPGAQNGRVSMPPEVRGRLGDTVELPCHLLSPGPKGNVSQVTWQRLDPSGNPQSVAAFHPSHGLSFPSPQFGKDRLSFRTMGQSPGARQGSEMRDATLVLQDLRVEDEGNFSCEFATFPLGTSRGVTWLRTIGEQGRGWGRWGSREVGEPLAGLFLSAFFAVFSQLASIKQVLFARCCSASWEYSSQQGIQQT